MPYFILEQILWGVFALAIIWIIFRSPRRGKRYREEKRRHDEEIEAAERRNAGLKSELDRLEERIRVLERIVTDDRHELRREFRDLGS